LPFRARDEIINAMFSTRFATACFRTFTTACVALALFMGVAIAPAVADQESFKFRLQKRVESPAGSDQFQVVTVSETWEPARTAVIVCDMWDLHHCKNAVKRVQEMAPRMNKFLESARRDGALIIHAPSACMEAYQDHPARRRARNAPMAANVPADIGQWCKQIPAEEKGKYPIDQSDGGEDDDLAEHAEWAKHLEQIGRNPKAPWKSQVDILRIAERDAITDSGVETWNLLEAGRIQNVILLGVHVNMCVLGRPFGLRQMARNGKHVVLVRDLTDSMYNPARWPYVDHYRGTDLIIEHIEKFVCPTVTSDQLLGGERFRFSGDPNAKRAGH
jgi:nicotinamidase-related amidase